MEDNYAPISQTLPYETQQNDMNNEDIYNRAMDSVPSNPYNVPNDHYVKLAMRQWKTCPSKVADEFFSVENIKRLQKKIKKEIYVRSYGKFKLTEDQRVLDLLVSMIKIYIDYGKDLDFKVISQVKMLNAQAIEYIVPDMIINIKQHYGYLDDITNPVNTLPDPINVNRSGRRLIPSVAQLYGI